MSSSMPPMAGTAAARPQTAESQNAPLFAQPQQEQQQSAAAAPSQLYPAIVPSLASSPSPTPSFVFIPPEKQLAPGGDEYLPLGIDAAGEKKVMPNGQLLGGREYRCRTFLVPNRGEKLFMLAVECARVLQYRDSYLLFNKNRSLFKIIANQAEKDDLIAQEILPRSFRSRQIAIVTARSMFRRFGSRVITNGRRVRDDYWETQARKQGFTEADLAGEKHPGATKALEAAEAGHAAAIHGAPHVNIVHTGAPRGGQSAASAAAGKGPAGTSSAADAMQAFSHGGEASSARSIPFNVEPPEIMGDLDQIVQEYPDSSSGREYDIVTKITNGPPQEITGFASSDFVGTGQPPVTAAATFHREDHTEFQKLEKAGRTANHIAYALGSVPMSADHGAYLSRNDQGLRLGADTAYYGVVNGTDREGSTKIGEWLGNSVPEAMLLLLACPFNIHDPLKYSAISGRSGKTYRTCAGPGFKSIQRLKEHLKRCHTPVQCSRCYLLFPGSDRSASLVQLKQHRQALESCKREDPSMEEGISDIKWALLEKQNRKRNQEVHRVEKWFEIWTVLFPGVPLPTTPWYRSSYYARLGIIKPDEPKDIEWSDSPGSGVPSLPRDNQGPSPEEVIQYEFPFTDSGYASAPNMDRYSYPTSAAEQIQGTRDSKPSSSFADGSAEDTSTIYDAATTVDPMRAQSYIAELCKDIHNQLRGCLHPGNWDSVFELLPALVKAFAIKIGHGSTTQAGRDIMYFIHRRNEEIATQLTKIFKHGQKYEGDDDQPEQGQRGLEGMSLLDKMNMWDNKAGEDDCNVSGDDLFKGVRDDEDEPDEPADLPGHQELIRSSAAYEWFLASLRKESLLEWSASQPRAMVDNVRHRILQHLKTGTISKREPPSKHEVEFILGLGLHSWATHRSYTIADVVAFTGSPDQAQATTVEQYLQQTWPANGVYLLKALLNAVDSRPQRQTTRLLDNARLQTVFEGSQLRCTATGPAYFIAECGELLSWLGAALSADKHDEIIYCMPSIKEYTVDPAPLAPLKSKGSCLVEITSNKTGRERRNCWQRIAKHHTLIQGFPIPRRLGGFPGLELPFQILLSLLGAESATLINDQILMEGRGTVIQLIKRSKDFFLWHSAHSIANTCSYFGAVSAFVRHDFHDLGLGRHILSACHCLDQEDALETTTREPQSSPMTCPGDCLSQVQPRSHDDETRHQNRNRSIKASKDARSLGRSEDLSGSVERQPIAAEVECPTPRQAPSEIYISTFSECGLSPDVASDQAEDAVLGFTSGSSNDSLDSAMFSISSSSEALGPSVYERDEELGQIVRETARKLLSDFRNQIQYPRAPGTSHGAATCPADTGTAASAVGSSLSDLHMPAGSAAPSQARKRRQEGDGNEEPPHKRTRVSQERNLRMLLACPYLKRDPARHSRCGTHRLNRIRDVKQHLSRRHTPARYCQRCLVTDFKDDQGLLAHIRIGECAFQDPELLDGISYQQRQQLSQKSKKASEEEQWFVVWDVLFPGRRRPPSAYLDGGLTFEMRLFREFCGSHGASLLLQHMDSKLSTVAYGASEEQRRAHQEEAITMGLQQLFEDWSSTTASSSSRHGGSSPGLAPSETAPSSVTDNAVILGDRPSPVLRQPLNYQQPSQDRTAMSSDLDAGLTNVDPAVPYTGGLESAASAGITEDSFFDFSLDLSTGNGQGVWDWFPDTTAYEDTSFS